MNKVPSGWQIKSLGEVANFINGRAFKPEEWNSKGLPIIRIQNLTSSDSVYNFFDGKIEDRYIVKKNDILISWSASLDVYIWNKESAVLNQHIFKVELNNNIDRIFFFYLIKTKIDEMISNVHGSTMKHITKDRFENIQINLPPHPIQKQIAEILEKADQAKQKRKEANKLTEQFLQSAFIEMFGDPIVNPKKWKAIDLGLLCSKITDGTHITPKYKSEGIRFISAKNIKNSQIDWSDIKYISVEEHNSLYKRCNPQKGDILLTKSGSLGVAAFVNVVFEFSLFESLALLKYDIKIINGQFLSFLINNESFRNYNKKSIKGISIKHLHLNEISKFKIIVPPIALQLQFADLVQKTEALKEKQKKSEIELENLFNTLMQKAFKGELIS